MVVFWRCTFRAIVYWSKIHHDNASFPRYQATLGLTVGWRKRLWSFCTAVGRVDCVCLQKGLSRIRTKRGRDQIGPRYSGRVDWKMYSLSLTQRLIDGGWKKRSLKALITLWSAAPYVMAALSAVQTKLTPANAKRSISQIRQEPKLDSSIHRAFVWLAFRHLNWRTGPPPFRSDSVSNYSSMADELLRRPLEIIANKRSVHPV